MRRAVLAFLIVCIAAQVGPAAPVDLAKIRSVMALTSIEVYSTPPSQFLTLVINAQRRLTTLAPKEVVDVVDVKQIKLIGHNDIWLNIRYTEGGELKTGWVFYGANSSPIMNFQITKSE